MFSVEQDLLKIPPKSSKMSLYTWAILCRVCMTQKSKKKNKKQPIAITHMREKHTGMPQNKHNFSFCFPATEQEEVVADVKHQFPG